MRHKRGDSFYCKATLPVSYPTGYFVGWTVSCQVRTPKDDFISDAVCTWENPTTTRVIEIGVADTSDWPLQDLVFDVQFIRDSDGFKISSSTTFINVISDITPP